MKTLGLVTDIWFRSELSLAAIARQLEFLNPVFDRENYWEWFVGQIDGNELDVTRTWTLPADQADTRIFRTDMCAFNTDLILLLVDRARKFVRGSVFCGRWTYTTGNQYQLSIETQFPASP